jgi:hypothetical protein
MALKYPNALWRPLETSQGEPPMSGHDIVCLHTMVGYLLSTDGYFRTGGWTGTESHLGIGGIWGPDLGGNMDGKVFQWQDLRYQADANLDGNPRVVSIETADNNPDRAVDIAPWTDRQVNAIVAFLDWFCDRAAHASCPASWACHQVGIPRVLIPDTKPGRRGIGYHAQGVPGVGLVPGGVKWSLSTGKTCPTARRIHQLQTVIIPRLRGTSPVPPPPPPIVPTEETMIVLEVTDAAAHPWLIGGGPPLELTTTQRTAYRSLEDVDGTPAGPIIPKSGVTLAELWILVDAEKRRWGIPTD